MNKTQLIVNCPPQKKKSYFLLKIDKYLLSVVFLFIAVSLFSQVQIKTEGVNIQEETASNKEIKTIIKTIEKAVKEYESAATFTDKTTREVNEQSIQRFKVLFENNTLIINDLKNEPSDLIHYSDYASLVYNYLKKGVETKLTKAKLVSITKDGDFYQAGVVITKKLMNGLEDKNKVVNWKKPLTSELLIIFNLNKNNLGTAKILKIEKYTTPNQKRKFFLIVSEKLNLSNSIKAFSSSTNFEFETSSSKPSFGLQIGYNLTNKLSVITGLLLNPKVLIKGKNEIATLSEEITIKSIELPIGARYSLKNKDNKLSYFGELFIIPAHFKITSEKNPSNMPNKDIQIDHFYNTTRWRFFSRATISGGMLYSFTKRIGLELALDYSIRGGKVIKNTEIIDLMSGDLNGSFLSEIKKKSTLGIRLGLNISF